MFKGRVERISHEGGLLVSYSGACPALDSVMVDSNENYVGKVDGVVGNLDNSLVHVAHLDRKNDANSMIGIEITIRARRPKQDRPQRRDNDRDNRQSRDNDRDNRQSRDNERRNDRGGGDRHGNNDWECPKCNNSNFAFRTECNRCGESKGTGGERRNDRRPKFDNRRDRNDNERHGNNDWECSKCNNSNFAFRTECNRCGESKGTGGERRNDRRPKSDNKRDRNDRNNNERHGNNDWECSKCNNSNFSFRTECNRCGEPKGHDGGKRNDRRPQRGERRGRDRNPRQNERRSNRDDDRKPRKDGREWSGNERRMGDRGGSSPTPQAGDWDCPQCGKSNFAKRTECFSCGRSKRIGGPRRKGHHFSHDPSPLRPHRYGKGDQRRDE